MSVGGDSGNLGTALKALAVLGVAFAAFVVVAQIVGLFPGPAGECWDTGGGACATRLEPNDRPVADVVGETLPEACRALDRSGYEGRVRTEAGSDAVEPGSVVAQEREPGYEGGIGEPINLTISSLDPDGKLAPDDYCRAER